MGQVIRLEAARQIGVEIARRPEYSALKKPRICDMKLMAAQFLASVSEKLGAGCRLSASARDTFERLQRGLQEFDPRDPELRAAVERAFRDERAGRAERETAAELDDPCERCESKNAEVKVSVTDLDGVLLDRERICRACAHDADLQVGR
jgi:hypothetical protein